MSYIGDNQYEYTSRRPLMKRVGTGLRQRVTVETGGDEGQYLKQDQERISKKVALERRRARQHKYVQYGGTYTRKTPVVPRRRYDTKAFTEDSDLAEDLWDADAPESQPDDIVDGGGDDYDFDLPKRPKAVTYFNDISFDIPGSDTNDNSHQPALETKTKFSGPMAELSIAHSRWLGSTLDRGELAGEVMTIGSPAEYPEKRSEPLMKWYHLERPMMSFEEFQAAALSKIHVPEKEYRDVVKLLRDVQKKFEKQRQLGRDMEPGCVSDIFYIDAKEGSPKQATSVMFLSFPYFCLEHYASAQINALTSGSPLHPVRPMLEAHFYASSQKRELAQAITSLSDTPQGACLHLSQVWVLVVDDNTMVTCSKLSLDALRGENIKKSAFSPTEKPQHIKISNGSDRSWLVPVTSSTTWPTFLSLFEDLLSTGNGASANFEYKNERIDGKSWPRVLEAAQSSGVELLMKDDPRVLFNDAELQTTYVSPAADGIEGVSQSAAEAQELPNTSVDADLHEVSSGPPDGNPDVSVILQSEPDPANSDSRNDATRRSEAVDQPLPEITGPSQTLQIFRNTDDPSLMNDSALTFHNILKSNNRAQERAAYLRCPVSTISNTTGWVALTNDYDGDETRTEEALSLMRQKRKIALLVRYLFGVFWPLTFEHTIVAKFWGAVYQILSREDEFYIQGRNDPRTDLDEASKIYKVLREDVLPLACALSREFLLYEQDLNPLPESFSKAWLHLIMAFVLMAQTTLTEGFIFHNGPISKHLYATAEELDSGRKEIMTRLRSTTELEDFEICTENSLLALALSNVASDIMHGRRRPDVATSYNDYFKRLDFTITEDPRPRSHQETLRFFSQEVGAIIATLEHQQSVLDAFQQSLEQRSTVSAQALTYGLGKLRQELVIGSLHARVTGRIDLFKGLRERAQALGEWHQGQIQTNKDRQEQAIFVFTIVTVIFLPLSFVSSVFGMNTKDVRSMSYDQWVYWATGLPLTVLVIFTSLWFAGEFEAFGQWLARSMSRSKKSSGEYEKLPEPSATKVYSMPVRRQRRSDGAADW